MLRENTELLNIYQPDYRLDRKLDMQKELDSAVPDTTTVLYQYDAMMNINSDLLMCLANAMHGVFSRYTSTSHIAPGDIQFVPGQLNFYGSYMISNTG